MRLPTKRWHVTFPNSKKSSNPPTLPKTRAARAFARAALVYRHLQIKYNLNANAFFKIIYFINRLPIGNRGHTIRKKYNMI